MLQPRAAGAVAAGFLALVHATVAVGAPSAPPNEAAANPGLTMAAYPSDKSIRQSAMIGGRRLTYRVTVGAIPVRARSGETTAAVAFTAYHLEDASVGERPLTFVIPGGPGSASATLHMGALGPKRLEFQRSQSHAQTLADNPDSWLAFTDLVFIDPVGTGLSRSFLSREDSRAAFYTYDADIAYLSEAIYDWMQANGRLNAAKYLAGVSYGGYRAPRIMEHLQTRMRTPFDGLILISPLMNQDQSKGIDVLSSPTPWIATLPTAAAAELDRRGSLTPEAMEKVESYARGDYALQLLSGWRQPEAVARVVDTVAAMTGVNRSYLSQTGGRIEPHSYLREIYKDQGKLANYYDVTVAYPNPFPVPDDFQTIFETTTDSTIPQRGAGVGDFITGTVGWRPPVRYLASNAEVNSDFVWARGTKDNESYSPLRRLLAQNTKLKVLIAHGYFDVACPYFADVLAIDQIPAPAGRDRVAFGTYAGGHSFYERILSLSAFTRDARRIYAR